MDLSTAYARTISEAPIPVDSGFSGVKVILYKGVAALRVTIDGDKRVFISKPSFTGGTKVMAEKVSFFFSSRRQDLALKFLAKNSREVEPGDKTSKVTLESIFEGENIPDSQRHGDCFEAAGKLIMDMALMPGAEHGDLRDSKKLVLVHAEVTGQGPIEGVNYGHAWVELNGLVLDTSNGRDIKMPVSIYYKAGQVNRKKMFRYTANETRRKMIDTGVYGPWDLKTKY